MNPPARVYGAASTNSHESRHGLANLDVSLMGLNRWGRKSDENYDTITTRVGGEVDIEIGFPVIDRPDVASLIDHHARLTHHRGEAWLSARTVQRISIVQKHLTTC